MGTALTVILNILLGVLGTALLASQITTGEAIGFDNGLQLNLQLYDMAFVLWIVLIILYFILAKKFLGKTLGGIAVERLLGKKK